MKRIPEEVGLEWLRGHILDSISPALALPWILDIDTTVKPLYGHQQGAEIGYNPQKPGRPSHTYHSYFVANLRISLGRRHPFWQEERGRLRDDGPVENPRQTPAFPLANFCPW